MVKNLLGWHTAISWIGRELPTESRKDDSDVPLVEPVQMCAMKQLILPLRTIRELKAGKKRSQQTVSVYDS